MLGRRKNGSSWTWNVGSAESSEKVWNEIEETSELQRIIQKYKKTSKTKYFLCRIKICAFEMAQELMHI